MTMLPAIFIGHGSPMNTLETNGFTSAWQQFGRSVPTPRGILAISAHWFIGATAVTAMSRPRTIHDFYGYPEALFEFEYPAPGLPELAEEVVEIAKPQWVGLDRDQWGLDHGTWSVLAHLFPEANIPVVQLSLNALKPLDYHVELGARLAALRERGVLIVASGNVVHNLRRVNWKNVDSAEPWAYRYDDAAIELLSNRPGDVVRLQEHNDYELAVPTPDHFLPLLYLAGIAATTSTSVSAWVRGCTLGSISMTCYGIGVEHIDAREGSGAAGLPRGVPPDQTNL